VTANLKWHVIFTNRDIKQAVDEGRKYVSGLKGTACGFEWVYDGFVNKKGTPHGPGVSTIGGQVQDGNWVNGELNGLSLCFNPNAWATASTRAVSLGDSVLAGSISAISFPNADGAINEDSARYEGQMKDHLKHGHGYGVLPNGARYFGEW